jgi:hypothetical protein
MVVGLVMGEEEKLSCHLLLLSSRNWRHYIVLKL